MRIIQARCINKDNGAAIVLMLASHSRAVIRLRLQTVSNQQVALPSGISDELRVVAISGCRYPSQGSRKRTYCAFSTTRLTHYTGDLYKHFNVREPDGRRTLQSRLRKLTAQVNSAMTMYPIWRVTHGRYCRPPCFDRQHMVIALHLFSMLHLFSALHLLVSFFRRSRFGLLLSDALGRHIFSLW